MTKRSHKLVDCLTVSFFTLSLSFGISGAQLTDTSNSSEQNVTPPELTIFQGTVRGVNLVSRSGKSFFGFLGLPYAKPPIGNLRFKSPVAADAWNGTLSGTTDPSACLQLSGNTVIGDEDCLFLNVYTPKIATNESETLLPVMFFIHGGGFESGSSNSSVFGPEYLMDKDIVFVALNYRLGILGFLSTGDEVAPGNYGLKDIVLALKWVKNNIAQFGGNPDKVTIFGQSTGAGAVELLTLSNSTNGLIHGYIAESGSAFSIRSFRPRKSYAMRATELGQYLGCPTYSSLKLVNCLKKLNASRIVNTKSYFYKWKTFPDLVWGPTNEPDTDEAFITETPTDLYAKGQVPALHQITGVVRDEGLILSAKFYVDSEMFEEFLTNLDDVLPYVLQYHEYIEDEGAFTKALMDYYLNDLNADRKVLLANLTQLIGDALFIHPIYRGLQERLAYRKIIEYFYSFEYRGTFSSTYEFSGGSTEDFGVAHSDELFYLFTNPKPSIHRIGREMSETDYRMVDAMVELWTSFAINGTPSSPLLGGRNIWRTYSREGNYLMIGNNKTVMLENHYFFLASRMQFWKRLKVTESKGKPTLGAKILSVISFVWDYITYIASSILDTVVSWFY